MATLNISLPGRMEAFVRAQCEGDYGNVSEYFRTLVREKMKQEIEADLSLLESTRSGAPAVRRDGMRVSSAQDISQSVSAD